MWIVSLTRKVVLLFVACASLLIIHRYLKSRPPFGSDAPRSPEAKMVSRRILGGGSVGMILFLTAHLAYRAASGLPPRGTEAAGEPLPYIGLLHAGVLGFGFGSVAGLLSRRWSR